jgi:uncharacterized glyoxalase superfamily protein PhnB
MIVKTHFILYVADQQASTAFYSSVLNAEPKLNVPGMTEFDVGNDAVLGLMPLSGAARLLGADAVDMNAGDRARAELYLIVDDPAASHERALNAGARELSPLRQRDWGHVAAYSLDPDGHVLAFAAEDSLPN